MNPKKKLRRCRASASIQALDLAISRFIHSLGLNGTLVEDNMRTFQGECEHFSFNMCPV